jgi:hypothetical protein
MSRTLPSMSYISLAILTRIEVDRLVDVLKDLHVPGGIIGGALVRIVLGRPPRSSPDLRRGMEIAPYRCRQLKGKTGPIAMTRNLETLSPTEELICGEFCSVDQICTPSTPLVKGKKPDSVVHTQVHNFQECYLVYYVRREQDQISWF